MSKPLTKQELHNLAMNHVGKDLQSRGFEFIAINSSLKKNPQFVCIDSNKQYYFVIVRAVVPPNNPNNYDIAWMEKFKTHAINHDSKVFYAGVGLAHAKDKKKPLYLDEDYEMEYSGIQVIQDNLN